MFVDKATIQIKAGDGGNGKVSFHREKYVAAGGPDGGDGGHGGSIIFQADTNLSTLADFRYKRKYAAQNGENGGARSCSGKNAKDLIIKVPLGTVIKDAETGRIMADISDGEPFTAAKGGRGGWGNRHFATPVRQCPRFAKSGAPGRAMEVTLELKLLADVGLVGFPNVGKSTLISVVSEAKPEIANYHFTTLSPVLGVVRVDEGTSFVMADIPGLIEGAGEGIGLGHEFLRHVERCRLLVHVVDVSGSEGRDPIEDFEKINGELSGFDPELAGRPMLVAGNKADLAEEGAAERFEQYVRGKGYEFFKMSAAIAEGTDELIKAAATRLAAIGPVRRFEAEEHPKEQFDDGKKRAFKIEAHDGVFFVEAPWILRILDDVNFDDYESLQYLQRVLRGSGIIDALVERGINDGDTVSIYDVEFDYVP